MRLYYAGCEPDSHRAAVVAGGGRNIFFSYYHLRLQAPGFVRQAAIMKGSHDLGLRIIIDSGAFTMMVEARKIGGKAAVTRAIEEYTDEYIAWATRMRSLFDYCIEMDLQHVVGLARVQRWRRDFADAGLSRQLWLGYHSCDDWPALDEVVQRSRWDQGGSGYMGIEGKNHPMSYRIDYPKAATHAYRNRVCVHAFASTRPAFLKEAPVASSDSTSYQAPARYGVTTAYDPLRCGAVTVQKTAADPRHRLAVATNAWRKGGFGGNEGVSGPKREATTVRQYVRMEAALTELWRSRGFDWEAIEAEHENDRRCLHGTQAARA